ncbi:MAG TPA: TIGR04282 family arsenosugar biosynthesis glycosyltransferase [Burkholderiaceae bacterium]|nr:TIGR04282 family arsenosugar biosynthesis glycosyltransferase [Burkholderiaceae bacterium]
MLAEPTVDIAVFARAPIPGQAKTRLIPRLGADGAAHLQRQLTAAALARARALPGARVTLWTTAASDDADARAAARGVGATVRTQLGADLGARMAHAFSHTLDARRPMLLIGTDCPAQTVGDLRAAAAALLRADAVVQPAEDGGYVLIGMNEPRPVLFTDIAWGSNLVLAATRTRAEEHGIRLAELPPCWDLDRSEDLDRALALGLVHLTAQA